jgi:iron complex transport system substrate-binding protein
MNAGCIQEDREKNENTVKITDMLDRTVKVPEKVDKVVGVGAGALRLLVYLECTDKVVGVEDIEKDGGKPYNYAHPELADLPFIGPMYGGDPELILIQEPEVIFWTYATVGDADELEEKTGIPVVVLGYGDLDDNKDVFYESLRLVAKVMGKETRAEELIQYIDDTIGYLNDRTKDIPDSQKQLVYVGGVSYYGNHGILSTEAAYSPFLYVNAKNVASELGMEHADIDKEKLIEWDPEIIFIDENGLYMVEEDLKDEAYASVLAVKNGEFYGVMPYNWYDVNFATVLANAYYVGKVLYPANFTDLDPEDKADDIYLKFVGKGVYQDMKDYYGGFKKLEL